MVCWNPKKVKERLNAKSNVSLYSRESLQSSTSGKEFTTGYLSNGEKIITFKRRTLLTFFKSLPIMFKESNEQLQKIEVAQEPVIEYVTDKLTAITDKALLKEISPLLKKNKVLESVEICSKYYTNKYRSMSFKDWFKLVNQLYQEINAQQ
jgi:hypothetical protein